jgi:hypothetical protein
MYKVLGSKVKEVLPSTQRARNALQEKKHLGLIDRKEREEISGTGIKPKQQ